MWPNYFAALSSIDNSAGSDQTTEKVHIHWTTENWIENYNRYKKPFCAWGTYQDYRSGPRIVQTIDTTEMS